MRNRKNYFHIEIKLFGDELFRAELSPNLLKVDHKMPEIHTCDKCGKCLKKKVSLLSHVKVDHENIKDHVCHLCGRGFARQQVSTKNHVQILQPLILTLERAFGPLLAPREGLRAPGVHGVNPGGQPQESEGDSKAI